ncbi:MAG TPA: OmpA family protein [bacterium]|jgi:hypothetical protein|nr:OmpA family protein [bacterium]HPG47366.1 OmpA family protein [bacterium]HPM99718.1 OmpA family protein [bacterium]
MQTDENTTAKQTVAASAFLPVTVWGVIGYLLLLLLALTRITPLEKRIETRARCQLTAAGFDSVQVQSRGRVLLLRGTVRDSVDKLALAELGGRFPGVRLVIDSTRCALPDPREQARRDLVLLLPRQRLHFPSGSTVIDAEGRESLNRLAVLLSKLPDVDIEIAGYTDDSGSPAQNLHLSQARADSVRRTLISLGCSEKSLVALGYGTLNPVADNRTPQGQSLNRRVEFHLLQENTDALSDR